MHDTSRHFIDSITRRSVGSLDYAVREIGPADGMPLLLLHGLLDSSASFAPLVDAIESQRPGHYRLIAADWRGHGESTHINDHYWFPTYVADLQALVDQARAAPTANHETVALLGHSMGGQIASLFAGLRPACVSHLITLDSLNAPDARPRDALKRYRRWLAAQRQAPDSRVHASVEAIAGHIATRYPELSARQRLDLADQWSRPAGSDGSRRMHFDPWHRVPSPYGVRADDAKAIWRAVTAPVLCIDAAESQALHYVDATEMADRRACFADIRHRVIPDVGHMLHVQNPAAVADLVCEFLDEVGGVMTWHRGPR